jgi:hypothetical protein
LYNTCGIQVNWNIFIQNFHLSYRQQSNTLPIATARSFYIRFIKRAHSGRADPLPMSTCHNLPDSETTSCTPFPQLPAIIQLASPGSCAYRSYIANHIKPQWGNALLADIKPLIDLAQKLIWPRG